MGSAGDVIIVPSKEWPVTQIKYSRMACRYLWTPLDSDIEVYGDANFAGCISPRKSPVGGIIMWSDQFVKAWSKTMGVLALSSGESELAAAVRAATQGLEDRHATEVQQTSRSTKRLHISGPLAGCPPPPKDESATITLRSPGATNHHAA